jgi:hypothetical protein
MSAADISAEDRAAEAAAEAWARQTPMVQFVDQLAALMAPLDQADRVRLWEEVCAAFYDREVVAKGRPLEEVGDEVWRTRQFLDWRLSMLDAPPAGSA